MRARGLALTGPRLRAAVEAKQQRAAREAAEQRLRMAREFLYMRGTLQRCTLSESEWLRFQLGCSADEAERLVAELSQRGK